MKNRASKQNLGQDRPKECCLEYFDGEKWALLATRDYADAQDQAVLDDAQRYTNQAIENSCSFPKWLEYYDLAESM